jgi:uncharacterized RDD family membrane protein YckC
VSTQLKPAGLLRRLGSAFYETLLVGALLLLIGFGFHLVIDPTHAEGQQRLGLQSVLGLTAGLYFVLFWSGPSSQTLAMKTWRLWITHRDGSRINRSIALRRWLLSLLWLAPGSLLGLILTRIDPSPAASLRLWLLSQTAGLLTYALLSLLLPERQFLHDLIGRTRLMTNQDPGRSARSSARP